MIDREELRFEAPELDDIARLNLYELGVLDLVLLELAFDEAKRHLRTVNRHGHVQVFVKIGQTTRMVLVAMRDNDAPQLVCMFEHVRVIRQNEVDARMIVIREHEPSIVEHHVVTALEHSHVLADGIETAQWYHFELGTNRLLLV